MFKIPECVKRFFETHPQRAKRLYDEDFARGVDFIDKLRKPVLRNGKMLYEVSPKKAEEVWRDINVLSKSAAMYAGMENRLEHMGYPDPRYASLISLESVLDSIDKVKKREPRTQAERTRLFYRLAARADQMDMETFVREFRNVFLVAIGDDEEKATTVQQIHYNHAWITGQKKDFNQYNLFANKRPKTLDVFFENRNTVNK